MIGGINL